MSQNKPLLLLAIGIGYFVLVMRGVMKTMAVILLVPQIICFINAKVFHGCHLAPHLKCAAHWLVAVDRKLYGFPTPGGTHPRVEAGGIC